jgi:hypothetical protein
LPVGDFVPHRRRASWNKRSSSDFNVTEITEFPRARGETLNH